MQTNSKTAEPERFEQEVLTRLDTIQQASLLQAKEVLTTEDVTLLTGIPLSTIYKMTSRKEIPHYKPRGTGSKLYFKKSEINDWLLHGKRKARQEIEDEADTYLAIHEY